MIIFLECQINRRIHISLKEKEYSPIFQFKYRHDINKDLHWLSGAPCHTDLPLATDQVQLTKFEEQSKDYQKLELPHQIQLDKVEIEIKTLICSPFIIVIIAVRLFVQSLESSTRRPAWWVLTIINDNFIIYNILHIILIVWFL